MIYEPAFLPRHLIDQAKRRKEETDANRNEKKQ